MPLLGIWPERDVRRLIEHYREVGGRAANIYALLAEPNALRPAGEEPQTDAHFALARAAELAFAIDDDNLGLAICRDIFVRAPRTPMEFVLWTMSAVLLNKGSVNLSSEGITVRVAAPDRAHRWSWPEASVAAAQMGRMLVTAAFASDPLVPALRAEMQAGVFTGPRAPAVAAIINSAEHRAVEALQASPQRVSEFGALQSLEVNYANRLNLMRAAPQWKLQRNNGSLVDWPLLMLWFGFFRSRSSLTIGVEPSEFRGYHNEDGLFLRRLASRLSAGPDQGQ
jgi:hypothetical protein